MALLVLNVTLQVGLTLIAGSHIVERSIQFKTSLVSGDEATTPWDKVINYAHDEGNEWKNAVKKHTNRALGTSAAKAGAGACCNGAECSEMRLPCCDRSGAEAHTPHQPMRKNFTQADVQELPGGSNASFLAVGKPGGKKEKAETKKKEDGEEEVHTASLCRKEGEGKNETLHCTPLSYGFMDAWDELDRDGDGKWTLEEARADEANLGCRLGLPVEEVFRSACRGVQKDNEDTSEQPPFNVHLVPLSITERRAVPKDYFDWWRGLAVMCVAHDVSRCGELVAKGLFDGAINAGHRFTKGGVQDLDSALDYCQRMLRPGGMCEKTLPGAYMMYRSRVTEKCGAPTYGTGPRYVNPRDSRDMMSTVDVEYSMVEEYRTAASLEFIFFQGLILFLWFVNLIGELKAAIQLADFVWSFEHDASLPLLTPHMRSYTRPAVDGLKRSVSGLRGIEAGMDEKEEDEELGEAPNLDENGNHVVMKISLVHKGMVAMMLLIRIALLVYMFHVGSMFLMTNHKYDDLLLNAVALAFIFELPEFLYTFLLSDEMKSALEGSHTCEYVTVLPTRGFPSFLLNKSLWGIVVIPIVVFVVVVYNYEVTTMPSLHALQCTCFQIGDSCSVSSRFSRQWWDTYWKEIATMFQKSAVFR